MSRLTGSIFALVALSGCGGDGGGATGPDDDRPDPGPELPAPPTALAVERVFEDRVVLSWTDVTTDETGFQVERRGSADPDFQVAGAVGADETGFSDGTVDASAEYVYRVRTLSAAGPSDPSAEVTARTPGPLAETGEAIAQTLDEVLPAADTPIDGRDLGAELLAAAPVVAEHPDVASVLVHAPSATMQIILTSGVSLVVPHNRFPSAADAPPAPPSPATASPGLLPRASSQPARTIPGSRRAVSIAIGGGDPDAAYFADLLSKAGYTVVPSDGSVESMRQYRDLGALYLDTHGAAFFEVNDIRLNEDGDVVGFGYGVQKYALQTTTEISAIDLGAYRDELERGDVVISLGGDFGGVLPGRWRTATLGITESFIRSNWQLDDAIVVLHACFSGADLFTGETDCFGACVDPAEAFDAGPIRNATLDAGASTVMGFDKFTWSSQARPSVEYFLDRLMGTNEVAPMADPERRAFDMAKVRASMVERSLLSFPKDDYTVNVTLDSRLDESAIIGVPSIESLDITDDAAQPDGELLVFGAFGQDEGTLTVGGEPVPVSSWSPSALEARVPFELMGDVVVEAPGGQKSNEVPFTEWRGGVTVTYDPGTGSLQAKSEVDVRFRADIHSPRREVEGDPEKPIAATYISPATFGRVTGSGTHSDENGSITFSGNYEVNVLDKSRVDAGGAELDVANFGGLVTLDLEARTAELCLFISGSVDVTTVTESGTMEQTLPVVFVPPELWDRQQNLLGCLNLPLAADYSIPGNARTYEEGSTKVTLDWTTFQPTNAPDAQTKG